ncbi:hypothetical protein DCAR_0522660 [Daucus carota subsp. sativus]|uniref:DUF7722 domain-containing protein n=1 Tax=Daucus carota subsp. sativus TaxID=79200 RepID=A0AAF0XAC3_DAUCS|nr:hypothetical protein DCAR_0522660 [Daucus carota subsp. sativus]
MVLVYKPIQIHINQPKLVQNHIPPGLLVVGGGSGMENGQQAKDLHKHFQMPEWKVNCLLAQYGLPVSGDVNQKRKFAVGAFLWSC